MIARRPIRTFTQGQVTQALDSVNIPYQIAGCQVNADLAGAGHFHLKITPSRGLYLDAATGKGGTIARFLDSLHLTPINPRPPVGATAPAGGQQQANNSLFPQKLWSSSWTCINAQDMPAGWDKGLNASQKGRARQKLEQQRTTVRTYLAARLGLAHLDHWSTQVRISSDGLLILPMKKNGQIVGIQRVFLRENGDKTDRKFAAGTNTAGVAILPVPAGIQPVPLIRDCHQITFVGEGWETVASAVQSAGYPGIVTYSAGGIVKWAQVQAEKAKSLSAEQVAAASAAVVLVDRDESQTGQKVSAKAVRILRAAGLKAHYAIPPAPEDRGPKGGPKGTDWGDYPKEGMSKDVLTAHLSLAIASGDQEMPKPEPDETVAEAFSLMPVRPAESPRNLAPVSAIEDARRSVQSSIAAFIDKAKKWRNDDGPAPTIAEEITTGTGKSHAIRQLLGQLSANKIPVVIIAKDKAACSEYEKAGAFWRHGREDLPGADWHCPTMSEGIQISEKEHHWGPTICASGHCAHGNKRAMRIAKEKNSEPSAHVVQFFMDRPELLPSAIDRCWLDHMAAARQRHVITCTSQGFGPGDAESENGKRIVIYDESADWTHSHLANLATFGGYIESIQRMVSEIEAESLLHDNDDDDDALDGLACLQQILPLMVGLAEALGKNPATHGAAVDAPAALIDMAKQIGDLSDKHTQSWEKPSWSRWTTLVGVPLRAAHEIIIAAKTGSLSIMDGRLLAVYQSTALSDVINSQPFLLADATIHPTIKSVIEHHGGEVNKVIADQQLRWISDPRRFRAAPQRDNRGKLDEAGIAQQVQGIVEALTDRKRVTHKIAIIAQRPKAIRALALVSGKTVQELKDLDKVELWDLSIQHAIGWWGWHEKAHDHWSGFDLIIWDQPAIPRPVLAQKWEEFRAILLAQRAERAERAAMDEFEATWLDDPPDGRAFSNADQQKQGQQNRAVDIILPHWTDDWEQGAWVNVGNFDQQSRAALHKTPEIREFIQNVMDGYRLQAAGRVRGVNHPGCIVYQMGGTPVASLPEHGIQIEFLVLDEAQTDDERKYAEHEAALHQCTHSAQRVIAKGQTITRKNLEVDCRDMGTNGRLGVCPMVPKDSMDRGTNPKTAPRHDTYSEWLEKFAPVLSHHLERTGRHARVVAELQAAAEKFGQESSRDALEVTENLWNMKDFDEDKVEAEARQNIMGIPQPSD
ncbi:toprim domain-containing protein [Acidithiobacillus sulfuriphilus]|uniref:Toprim domain-containing protein n=2 Tax=Acidithiobacillus sulfuriphilus TaxID=1867749 RepID=A0A3M8QTV8_9PROT|nr:toprim domain-containing protein [Acidithiobacillus sulfuriphilus]RNF59648.1 hypothetical protein EC580_10705 [Acidithiobacillus sulfuriphilus]